MSICDFISLLIWINVCVYYTHLFNYFWCIPLFSLPFFPSHIHSFFSLALFLSLMLLSLNIVLSRISLSIYLIYMHTHTQSFTFSVSLTHFSSLPLFPLVCIMPLFSSSNLFSYLSLFRAHSCFLLFSSHPFYFFSPFLNFLYRTLFHINYQCISLFIYLSKFVCSNGCPRAIDLLSISTYNGVDFS